MRIGKGYYEMKNPLISVIVPMYNAEKYIEKCLESVMRQSFDDYEVIVVDDGSKDLSPRIADQFAKNYQNLKVIHQENSGVIRARKTGVQNASGEYILNLDSDDWLLNDHLFCIAEEIKDNCPDIVVTGYIEDNKGVQTEYCQNIAPGFYSGIQMQSEIIAKFISTKKFFSFGIYPTLWTSCIKSDLVRNAQVNLPETYSIGEDISVTYPCIIQASSLSVLNIHSYIYRIQHESMTHVFDEKFSEKVIYLLEYLKLALPKYITNSDQFRDYVVFETCLLVSSYLELGIKKHPYKEMIDRINAAIQHPIISEAVFSIDIKQKNIPLKYKVKIFLIKKHWFKLFSALLK